MKLTSDSQGTNFLAFEDNALAIFSAELGFSQIITSCILTSTPYNFSQYK